MKCYTNFLRIYAMKSRQNVLFPLFFIIFSLVLFTGCGGANRFKSFTEFGTTMFSFAVILIIIVVYMGYFTGADDDNID